MSKAVPVKICGLIDHASVQAACNAGARYLGFNFFPRSLRYADPALAAQLAADVPVGICKVALVVDEDDAFLDDLVDRVPIDMLQFHGKESPERVAELRDRYGLPVMKAVGVADESDLPALDDYARVVDQLLVDAKAPKDAALPGGNGLTFDWRLIAGRHWTVPWMLAGGLTPDNVAEAIQLTGAQQVDVSSGVESAPGQKDPDRIAAFIQASMGPT